MDRTAALRTLSRPSGLFVVILALFLAGCDATGPGSSAPEPSPEEAAQEIPAFDGATDVSVPGPAAAVTQAEARSAAATIPVADGWTLLSVPLDSTAAIENAFPSCSSAFVYEPGGGYQSVPDADPLPPGRGAFLNCTADTVSVSGPVPDPTVSLSDGWNLIGPHAQTVATGDLSTHPEGLLETSFFAFDPDGGYTAADSLRPGHGYWVKAGGPGTLPRYTRSLWSRASTGRRPRLRY